MIPAGDAKASARAGIRVINGFSFEQ